MVRESVLPTSQPERTPLAPRWHTMALVGLIVGVALVGTLLQHYRAHVPVPMSAPRAPDSRILDQYLPILLVNFGLTLYCCRLFRTRSALSTLLGASWHSPRRAASDLALALATGGVVLLVEMLYMRLFGVGRNAAVSILLPGTEAERLTWVLVALSAGFCEEVIYRGYLQAQLSAFAGHAAWGIGLQAALFGLAHAEQGAAAALRIAIYGLLFGVLARARGSLLPGIVCHAGIDLASGFH